MINHDRHRNTCKEGKHLFENARFEIDYVMSSQSRNAMSDRKEPVLGRLVDQPLEEVEPDPRLRDRVQCRAVVGVVTACLHDHVTHSGMICRPSALRERCNLVGSHQNRKACISITKIDC